MSEPKKPKKEKEETKPPGTKLCDIDKLLSNDMISLCKLCPDNPIVHGVLMSKLGKMPPKDADTYEKIKAWAETTFEERKWKLSNEYPPINFAVAVDSSRKETGTARFRRVMRGSPIARFTEEEILGMCEIAASEPACDSRYEKLKSLLKEATLRRVADSPDRFVSQSSVTLDEVNIDGVTEENLRTPSPSMDRLREILYYRCYDLTMHIFGG